MTTSHAHDTQILFCRALAVVRTLPDNDTVQLTASERLNLYGLYKQATQGDCTQPKPSSRDVAECAKWKAWDRLQGLCPTDAQTFYVEALVELIGEFIKVYPHHPHVDSLSESLNYLEQTNYSEQDNFDETNPEREEEYYLGPIQSPLGNYSLPRHYALSEPSLLTNTTNKTTTSHSTQEYPMTPDLSPSSYQKMQNRWPRRYYVQPMDFLHQSNDLVSEADTIDREVAAITAPLALNSPDYHPHLNHHNSQSQNQYQQYQNQFSNSNNNNYYNQYQEQDNYNKSSSSLSLSLSSSPPPPPTSSITRKQSKSRQNSGLTKPQPLRPGPTERAMEILQTEVTGLAEQLAILRWQQVERDTRKRQLRWSWWWLGKTVLKHALVDTIIFFVVFLIMSRQGSPWAHMVLQRIGGGTQKMIRSFVRRAVLWKAT